MQASSVGHMTHAIPRTPGWLRLALCLALGLATPSDPRTPVDAGWAGELTRLAARVEALPSDLARTTFLREYTGALLDIGRPDERTLRRYQAVDFDSFDPAEYYPLFRDNSLPANCGITSYYYIKLLHALGFKAYQYSFGFSEKPYQRFIHSVALVEIGVNRTRRLIVQDPYLNLTYRTRDGQPMDFIAFLAAIRARRYDEIVTDASSLTTALLVPDASLYLRHLSRECQAGLIGLLERPHGSRRAELPIVRSYATLMQSDCDRFERDFLEAMRQHGLHEPFLYAYTLRAAELVGSADHAEVQRRIDAVLR